MSGAFFNAPTQAGNLDLAMTNTNGITTTSGELSLTANNNGAISIGNTSTGQVQLTVNNSGVIIQDNLQVLGNQNTFNADDVTTSTLRMNNETLGDTDNVSVSKSVSLINRTSSGDNTVTIPVKSYLHNELSQDGLIKNIFYDETSVAQADQAATSTTVDFTWPKYYPVGPVTHKVAATVSAAFANRDALNGLSVGTANTTDNTIQIGTVTVNYTSHSGSSWLNNITESTNPGDWTVTTATTSGGAYSANNTATWTKDLFVKIQYIGQTGEVNEVVFENSAPNPAQNATNFHTALASAQPGDIVELAEGVYDTLTINKSIKVVSAPGTKALLQGGLKISSPSAAPINGLELVNLKVQGNCGLNTATVSQSGGTGYVKDINVVGCEFDGKEVANLKFWYGKFNVGYWRFNSCIVTGYRSWYLMDNTSSSYFAPIPFAGCTEYLSDVQIVNCHFNNNTGTPCFRGGGGSTDGNGGGDPSVMVSPIDTALVQNSTFDFSNIDYDNTPAAQKGWCSVEVNKVKKLTVNNNMFKNRVNAQPSNKHSHSYHVQCWGVPGEAEDSWELVVTNNKFILESAHPYVNGHPSGGVIIANGSGSSEKGWGLSDGSSGFIALPNPKATVNNNSFENMDYGVTALAWYKPNPVTIRTSNANGGPARYVPTTGVTLGGEVTDGAAYSIPTATDFANGVGNVSWSATGQSFQINLERQTGIPSDNSDSPPAGTVEYWNGDRTAQGNTSEPHYDADGHLEHGNWVDGDQYNFHYNQNVNSMVINNYGDVAGVSEGNADDPVQWTITSNNWGKAYGQTVLRGHIDTTSQPGKTRFVVRLSDVGYPEYRTWDPSLHVNPQESFTSGAHCELVAYVFDGPISSMTATSVLTAELLTTGASGTPNKTTSIIYADGSKTPNDGNDVMYGRPGKINCNDNHWGGVCQPSRLGAKGWGEFGVGRDYQHLYSSNSDAATVTPNVVTTDVVSAAPSVAQTAGRKVVVTTEGNYYPVYLNEPVVQETVEFRVRVFDRQGHAGKAYFIWNADCNQWEESPVLRMKPSNLYLFRFDLATDLASYPMGLSTTNDGTHNSGTSYESSSIPSVDGQFVTVYPHVHDDIGQNLHYYCTGTSGMGNEIATQRTARTDSGNNVIDVAWDTDAATSATAVETAIAGAPEGSIIRLEGGSTKPWGAINITKSCKLVSKTDETAHLTGGIVLTPPDNTVIDGVELWNLSVKGGAANTNESPGGTTCLWVNLDGSTQGAVNNLKIMNCEFDGEGTSGAKHFANFTYVTGELTIDNCNIHHFEQHYYLSGMSQGWIPKASIVNNAEGYLSDVVFTNNHIHNCVGTPCFRGGAGTNDNGANPDTCFVEKPINTATVTGNKFDYTSTAASEGVKGWNCIEINKCVSVQINNNHFVNHRRGDAGAGYNQDFAHGFAVQAFSYDNWGLQVCNNHFQNDAGLTDKTGGVYVHLAQWTQTVNGLGGSSVKMACPSTMISGNHFNGTEHALYFGQGFQEFIANNFSDDVRTDVGQTPPQIYAPNNYFGPGGASKRQRLVGSTTVYNDYDTSNGDYSTVSFNNWTDFAGLSVVEHFVGTDARAKQSVGTITLKDANNRTMRFNVLSTTATNSLKGKTVTTGITNNSGANLEVMTATTQALLSTDSVAVEVAKSNTLSSAVYIKLTDGTDTVEFINVGVQNGTVTPNVNMNVYEEDALTNVGLNASPLDTHEKEKLLVVGGGLASALKFNSTGQSANILFLGGKWRVVQAGAAVLL